MHELLSALRRGDSRGEIMSSDTLATDLGWSPAEVAATLRDARAAMFIWGLRSGGTPQPHFDEIELTVQGNRYLRDAPPDGVMGDLMTPRPAHSQTPIEPEL